MARSLLAAGTLLLALALCARAQDTVTVNNDRQAARALGEQSVTTIQLAYDVNLANSADFIDSYVAQKGGPLTINRQLTITSAPGSSSRRVIDFGYLASKVVIGSGQTITFDNVQLRRAQVAAPVGIFAYSPGATVVLNNAEYVLQACWSQEASQYYHTQFFRRTIPGSTQQPGTQNATFSPGSYMFYDVQFTLPQLTVGSVSTGGYSLVQRDTLITCRAYEQNVSCDFQSDPIGCLNTVYNPGLLPILCPQCTCVNDCLTLCQSGGVPGPASTC